jgi:hypothetical protein
MAKYRITSIPQSLPKAQKGLFKNKLDIKTSQNKFKNLFDKGVLDNKGHINLFGKNKKGNSNQQIAPQETWSGVTPELIQPGQDPFELEPTYTPFAEFTQSEVNVNDTLNKIAEERARLAEEKENKDWEEMMQKREEAFKISKKYDKIEPLYTIDSEGYTDEDFAGFQESGFFPVKDSKTNKIKLYPTNEINSRIINNGLRTSEIVNKLGIGDEKLIQGSFGDLMKAADEEYSSTVQSKLLQKSLDEGISLEEAAKKLSGKLGTEKGIQNYIKPTKELINTYIDNIKGDLNKPAEKELKSMYLDNRDPNATYSPKIDYNSADPGLKYNMDYYNTTGDWGKFLKDYSDYNKEYDKEYADSFYNKQNQNADRLNLPVSDRTGGLKNQLDATNQNISLTKQIGDTSTEAGNKTINKNYIEQLQADMTRASDPLVKYELSKKLDAVKNNPEAFSKLLKKFDTGEVFTKEDEDNINALTFSILQKESGQDKIKAGIDKPELTRTDKALDILTNPFDAFKYSNQGGLNNMWSSGMGYNERKLLERANPGLDLGTQDNLVGNALNTWNPMRFARDVDSDLDREDYASAGLEALEFATPAIFSKAARAGRLARDASKFFPTGSSTPGLKGFTGAAFDAMNPYFAYEAIRPDGDFNRSYDAFQSGDIRGGLEEGAYGALGLLGVNGARGVKGFNTPLTKPFNANRVAFKKGGSLPTYQGPIRSIVKGTKNIAKTALNLKDSKKLINNALMNSAYESLAQALYKNQSIQPLTDMLGSISNTDAKYLLTDALNQTNNPYEDLSNLMSNVDVDYSNIGDFNRNTLDFAKRRHAAGSLKELGYVGQDVNDLDLYKMAASEEAMNKVMQNAIAHDRTGYRQVSGKFNPTGKYLGGYDSMQRQYDMFRPLNMDISEVDNMRFKNVDRSNPLSLASYQATHIPMEPYGYRAGVESTDKYDALYLSSVPLKQEYGPYQFKIQRPLDFSTGNWQDWLEKYIHGKKTYKKDLKENLRTFNPLEVYDDVGYNQGKKNIFNIELGKPTGSGMHTRYWYSGLGNEPGIIDPDFPFMDLQNMSAEDYMEMERYKQGIIDKYNTGWRGEYKKGGISMKLSQKEIDQYIKEGYIVEEID